MNGHLTERQISEWTWGERPSAIREHLACCPACQKQVQLLDDSLTAFRGAVRSISEQRRLVTPAPSTAFMHWKFAWALAALLICVALGSFWPHPTLAPAPVTTASTLTDAALLERIDSEVSQTAPSSLQPLAQLDASDRLNQTKAAQ